VTNNSDNETIEQNIDFGSPLREARERQKLSVDEIADLLKIPTAVIEAIESSDTDKLPPATFTRGYLRGFAKFVEINPNNVLAAYDRAVPQNADYKPRSNLQVEANRQSSRTKTITYALIIVGLVGVVFAAVQYYNDKAEQMKASSQARTDKADSKAGSLDKPAIKSLPRQGSENHFSKNQISKNKASQKIDIRQNASLSSDGELQINKSYPSVDLSQTNNESTVTNKKVENISTKVAGSSKVEFFAKKGAWLQIKDASGKRLHYDMIAKGKWFVVNGKGPFKVSLGNARSTTMKINGLNVDMSAHIKPNNIAQFKASVVQTDNGPVIDIR